jgi:DNA helicase HerA-like ATPase
MLVRIHSQDGHRYLGIVAAGPFAEPDSLRGDSHMLVTVATRGGVYLPPYHGRAQLAILGEELKDGALVPPRLRPLPNSPIVPLTDTEAAVVLRTEGDIRLGLVVGHDNLVVNVPSKKKLVLPRHLAILGTTGSGKSTTVARLIQQAQAAGMAVIVLDVEGEYTHLHEPTDHDDMVLALKERGLEPTGLVRDQARLYHLAGRGTVNPDHPHVQAFSLQFARLSPYAAMEILGLSDSEAQQVRFLKAYDLAKDVMRDLGIFPQKNATPDQRAEQERMVLELDEFERGYPRLTLSFQIDIASACLARADRATRDNKKSKGEEPPAAEFKPFNTVLTTPEGQRALTIRLNATDVPGNTISWKALLAKLWRLHRLKVFFNEQDGVKPMNYTDLLKPGQVSILDLSDSGASELNNIVIADILRGVQDAQDAAYQSYEKAKDKKPSAELPRVLIVIEEAHEFLSAERIDKLKILFEQVARIAKRGRKRYLGLAFVTQLPGHLPRQVLVNSFILHKLTDPHVLDGLKRTVSGIDPALWNRVAGLAPGQAIVSFPHMTRPLLVAIDPTPGKLRLAE